MTLEEAAGTARATDAGGKEAPAANGRCFARGSNLAGGVKVTWPDRWLLARPSVTEPVIRLAAEAPTEAEARSLVNRVLEVLSPGA